MKTHVICTLQFEGFHSWPDAPDSIEGTDVSYLRNRHRHMFHVKATKEVSHAERDIEFIALKHRIVAEILRVQAAINWSGPVSNGIIPVENWSCEMWAQHLLDIFGLSMCQVMEDNENGAMVIR